ncbi:MAG TPA: AAA family ATPase [Candidatus Saccharimonadales bacterium]|nr:AAA family ATPase [Candidatus Saccharimonadales bacterium]
MSKFTLPQIYQNYLQRLNNLRVPQEKFVILFSGVPASGKTTLAERLSKHFSAVYISSDVLRSTIKEMYPSIKPDQLEKVAETFARDYYPQLFTLPNKFHVVDANLDVQLGMMEQYRQLGVPQFIIRINTDKDQLVERINGRSGHFQEKTLILRELDKKLSKHAKFMRNFSDLVSYTIDSREGFLFDELVRDIDKCRLSLEV